MARPSGMSRMVHDYKERNNVKETGRYWEIDSEMEPVRVTADLDGSADTVALGQGGSQEDIIITIGEVEGLIEVLRTAKKFLEGQKKT